MERIRIKCPSCSSMGFIEVSAESMKNSTRGLLAVNIAKDIVCSHTFIAYIDRNLNVRDYFISDFNIELPEITQEEISKAGAIPSKDILDIDLIKLNLPATLLAYVLRSIFLKQKIVIIFDQEFLYRHISNFFKYITKNAFEANIILITHEDYKKNKNDYKDAMVFESIEIIRNNKKLINPKKLYIEKQIINNFMTEGDLGYSYIVLRNEIQRSYDYAKSIFEYNNNLKKGERINILKISNELETKHGFKLSSSYLNFLTEIVQHYYGIKLPSLTASFLDMY